MGSTWSAATARSPKAASSASATGSGRPPYPETARITVASTTPVTSCSTLQPSRPSSVGLSVVVRRLERVMFTTTTELDIATDTPTRAAPSGATPSAANTRAAIRVVTPICAGDAHSRPPCSRRRRPRSTSMPTSNRSSTTPTSASSSIWWRSATYPGVNRETTSPAAQVADHRGQPELARHPAEPGRQQQREADVEQERGRLHGPRIAAQFAGFGTNRLESASPEATPPGSSC